MKYRSTYNKQAKKLCLLGATDKDLAKFFEVTEQTINNWKNRYPSFAKSLVDAKIEADAKVVRALYARATGYDHEDTYFSSYQGHVTATKYMKHFPPDVVAQIFWLKNRQQQNWRDRHEVTGEDGGPIVLKLGDEFKNV